MSERIQRRPVQRVEREIDQPVQQARQSEDVDLEAVLDEIDATLTGQAEDYVRGFVQKGGQ
jgi:ubiquitin-like protein Pup